MSDFEEIEFPKKDFEKKEDEINAAIKKIDSNTLKTKTILIKLIDDRYEFYKSKKDR
jgi:hypothetical protein